MMHSAVSGAPPVPVLEFLAGLGFPVYEVCGLSETIGATTGSTRDACTFGETAPAGTKQHGLGTIDLSKLAQNPAVRRKLGRPLST